MGGSRVLGKRGHTKTRRVSLPLGYKKAPQPPPRSANRAGLLYSVFVARFIVRFYLIKLAPMLKWNILIYN